MVKQLKVQDQGTSDVMEFHLESHRDMIRLWAHCGDSSNVVMTFYIVDGKVACKRQQLSNEFTQHCMVDQYDYIEEG